MKRRPRAARPEAPGSANPGSRSSFSSRSTVVPHPSDPRLRDAVTGVTAGSGARSPSPRTVCSIPPGSPAGPTDAERGAVPTANLRRPARLPGLRSGNGPGGGLDASPSTSRDRRLTSPQMSSFAVVAHRVTPTNTRLGLGRLARPGRGTSRARRHRARTPRRPAVARRVEPGLWALERLAASGVTVLNGRRTLIAAHDKLATAATLFAAGVPHPRTVHVAPWLRAAGARAADRLQAALRLVGAGRDPLRRRAGDRAHAARARDAARGTRRPARSRRSSSRRAATTCGIVVAAGAGRRRGAPRRRPGRVADERRARRAPRADPAAARGVRARARAARAVDGALVGIDLLPADVGTWVVLEVNGAVDFNSVVLARRRRLRRRRLRRYEV